MSIRVEKAAEQVSCGFSSPADARGQQPLTDYPLEDLPVDSTCLHQTSRRSGQPQRAALIHIIIVRVVHDFASAGCGEGVADQPVPVVPPELPAVVELVAPAPSVPDSAASICSQHGVVLLVAIRARLGANGEAGRTEFRSGCGPARQGPGIHARTQVWRRSRRRLHSEHDRASMLEQTRSSR